MVVTHEKNEFTAKFDNFMEEFTRSDLSKLSQTELQKMESEANDIETEYNNFQLVVKADANSIYGSSGSPFFSLYSPRIAGDITQTGKHFTVLIDRAINKFFQTWADDPQNLIDIQKIYPEVVRLENFTNYEPDTYNDMCCYGDTDSRYFRLDWVYKMMKLADGSSKPIPNSNEDLANFGEFVDGKYLSQIIKQTIEADCLKRNARIGYMKMSHEVTTRRTSFIKKKKYIMNVIWKDGKLIKQGGKMKFQGVEIKRGSTSDKSKKILERLAIKYIQENAEIEEIRKDCLKVLQFIKAKKDKEIIYALTSVSGLENIRLENDRYVSDKSHIQIQIATSWLNFIHKNKLHGEYQPPFEGQKMQWYYCAANSDYKVMGIPDNIDISMVKNLPEPDWTRMTIDTIIKPLCRYILETSEVSTKDVENFLLGVRDVRQLF